MLERYGRMKAKAKNVILGFSMLKLRRILKQYPEGLVLTEASILVIMAVYECIQNHLSLLNLIRRVTDM